jgi:hypothetical protein
MEDENGSIKYYRTIGVVLILLGIALFFLNYERQTLPIDEISPDQGIINYYAPLWDPLPHHVRVTVEASEDVVVKKVIDRDTSAAEILRLKADETTFHVYPGETIKIYIENTGATHGAVKTLLWCDSWNYAASILLVAGLISLFFSRPRP